jgi:hypothetical protein
LWIYGTLNKISIPISIWSNILPMKEVLRLLLTKYYFLNLKSKLPINNYTNVSVDPLELLAHPMGFTDHNLGTTSICKF